MAPHDSPLTQWLTALLYRGAALDPDWGAAIAAEGESVPAGRARLFWALGGLWFLARRMILRQRATLAHRVFAGLGVAWAGMWTYAFAQSLWDDAPDMPWPYSLWLVAGQAGVLVAFSLALWRPVAALLCAGPMLLAEAVTDWAVPGASGGSRAVALAVFTGFPAAIFGLLALLTVAALASGRSSSERPTAR